MYDLCSSNKTVCIVIIVSCEGLVRVSSRELEQVVVHHSAKKKKKSFLEIQPVILQ